MLTPPCEDKEEQMRVESQGVNYNLSNQYYDGTKNGLEFELREAKKELGKIIDQQQDKNVQDSRVSMLVAQVTGIGAKLNFYI